MKLTHAKELLADIVNGLPRGLGKLALWALMFIITHLGLLVAGFAWYMERWHRCFGGCIDQGFTSADLPYLGVAVLLGIGALVCWSRCFGPPYD